MNYPATRGTPTIDAQQAVSLLKEKTDIKKNIKLQTVALREDIEPGLPQLFISNE